MSRRTVKVPKKIGRPSPITDTDRIETLLELLRKGNHATTAAAYVGVAQSTLYKWLSQAADAEAALTEARAEAEAEGRPEPPAHTIVTAHQARLVEFAHKYARARAEGETRVVGVIGKVIEGGYLISRRPALTGDGTPIYDESGALVFEEVYAQPDGKLGLEFLGRAHPTRWGRLGPMQVELTGEGGGPVQVESSVQVRALAERLAETLALPAGDDRVGYGQQEEPVEGEVVEG